MSLQNNALATLDEAKHYIGMADPSQDIVLELFINAVSDRIESFAGRKFKSASYTNQYFDGGGRDRLYLPAWPITAVASVVEDGVTLTEGLLADYVYYGGDDDGYLLRIDAVWLDGPKTVKVSWTGGYLTIPSDLKLACLTQVAAEWKTQKNRSWGEVSRSAKDASVTVISDSGSLLKPVQEIVKRYWRFRL